MTDSTCRYCQRSITLADDRWVDPEATGDDSVWRETCDAHHTFTAEHVPDGGEDFDDFVRGYVEAMLWANTYDGRHPSGMFDMADDALADVRDGTLTLDDAAAAELREDCADFLTPQVVRLIQGAMRRSGGYGFVGAGHDFALTRNGHGAGFWDRGLGIVGEALTTLAKSYGTRSLFVDSDDVVRIFE